MYYRALDSHYETWKNLESVLADRTQHQSVVSLCAAIKQSADQIAQTNAIANVDYDGLRKLQRGLLASMQIIAELKNSASIA